MVLTPGHIESMLADDLEPTGGRAPRGRHAQSTTSCISLAGSPASTARSRSASNPPCAYHKVDPRQISRVLCKLVGPVSPVRSALITHEECERSRHDAMSKCVWASMYMTRLPGWL